MVGGVIHSRQDAKAVGERTVAGGSGNLGLQPQLGGEATQAGAPICAGGGHHPPQPHQTLSLPPLYLKSVRQVRK